MNTKMLMLGILLIADKGGPDNWMQSVEGRYSCLADPYVTAGYNDRLYDLAGDNCDMNTETLGGYLYAGGMMYDLYDMCEHSGCYGGPISVADFRSGMLGFNVNNAGFRSTFLSMMRECISNPAVCDCTRSEILSGMQSAMSAYRSCVSSGIYCYCGPT
jgi:hypothetical protein